LLPLTKENIVGVLSPGELTEQKSMNDIVESLQVGDNPVMAVVIFIFYQLGDFKGKEDTNIYVNTIKYADFITKPKNQLVKFCTFN